MWEPRIRTPLVYSSVVCCLGFRGEKWLAATSSRPSSETIRLPGTRTSALRSNQQQLLWTARVSHEWALRESSDWPARFLLPIIRFLPLSTSQRRRPWKRCSSQTLQTSATSERRWAWNEVFRFDPSWFGFPAVAKSDVIYVFRGAGETENNGWVESIIRRVRLVGSSPRDSHFFMSSSASVHFSSFAPTQTYNCSLGTKYLESKNKFAVRFTSFYDFETINGLLWLYYLVDSPLWKIRKVLPFY